MTVINLPTGIGVVISLLVITLIGCNNNDNSIDTSIVVSDENISSITTIESNSDLGLMIAPTGMALKAEKNALLLSWNHLDNVQAYRLYWSDNNNVSEISNYIDGAETKYKHEGLLENKRYYYRVSAWINNEESSLSSIYSEKTLSSKFSGGDDGGS